MYKLLLATDRPEVIETFNAVKSWELMGFHTPRMASTISEAMNSLDRHHADAVVMAFSPEDEAELMAYLNASHPITPVVEPEIRPALMEQRLAELRHLLSRMHADFSNDDFGEADMLQLCRREFFRALMNGRIREKADVKRYLHLLRSRMDAEKPCVVLELAMAPGDDYLSGRWHYGPERLELALRNFFGAELNGMRMLPVLLPGDRIELMACPMTGNETVQSMTSVVSDHAQSCMAHVRDYLDLDLHIANIRVLPALTALAINH
ncbi:MAG: hypothetical protein E7333_06750 [Clostridiales bacterium]|nr:hypothetical protein [Clostridiales bacterium]